MPMKVRARSRLRFALVCLVAAVVPVPGGSRTALAQNWGGVWTQLTAGGTIMPPPPPVQGDFFEVIFANAKWLVVQNKDGQQFPVAADSIAGQFLIRWQAGLGDLTPAVLVEAIGPEQGSMTLMTDHIDIFKGSDQTLVQPGYASVLPINRPVIAIDPTFGRTMNGFEISKQNQLYSWVFPVPPGYSGIPSNMHAVGNSVALYPLRLAVPGNNIATVIPPPGSGMFTISQVTKGDPSFARKGDMAYLTPVRGDWAGPKSLKLTGVVLYKKIRLDQFVP